MDAPTVSVILPTYNRAGLLPRALDSIIAQTYTDWEIVLVDDGSTDETPGIARAYARRLGERLVYVRQSNTGCGGARNRGIETTRGRFVAFLDSDDEYLSHKLERQLALFDLRPELGFVYGDYAYVDTEGIRHTSMFNTISPIAREVKSEEIAPRLHVCGEDVFDVLLRRYFIATIVGMVRREVFGESIRWSADPSYSAEWLVYLKVTRACRSGFVDEPLCLHHHVPKSLTRTNSHRNTVRMRNLLHEMLGALTGLTAPQRRVIRKNLAGVCRQLGFDRYRCGAYGDAVRFFGEALGNEPSARTAWHTLQSLGRLAIPRSPRVRGAKAPSQAV